MAGVIGEAFISASIQVLCDRITSGEFVDFFRHKKLNEPLLMKLKMTLLTLNAVLNDAEEKQLSNLAVREWLDELKHAVFDAEDLLSEINTEALRCKVEGEDQTNNLTKKVWNFLSTSPNNFYRSMNVKIEELLERLGSFVEQKSALGLTEVAGRKVSQRTPTTSLVHETCVYGRDENKENLLEVLLSDDASGNNVSIITIVGMGGVGKTTLARLLYNDDKVKQHFTVAAWSCVSEDYDAVMVTKTLLESVTSRPCRITDLNLLQVKLREQVRGKKFLFVLDDLWNEKYVDWKCLQTPFTSGARGSKIIVTTRNKNVADVMKNVPIQYLKPLSHEDCWSILAKHAFENEKHCANPDLEDIGKQIAHKCNGLPLAAETLGGLLRCKIDPEEWNGVLNSSIWELPLDKSDILPALALSYHDLPAQLKRCFVYCSIFPKDYVFEKEDIIQLWMAEGLIPQVDNGNRMEEVAKEYFDELLSRSLFQKLRDYKGVRFTMHDLINDLAMFVSKGFCFRLEEKESNALPERVRHLSYIRGVLDVAPKFEALYGIKCLRTFLPMSLDKEYWDRYISNRVLNDLLPALRSLRVLKLSGYKNVSEIPDSIGNLIHLHYLDLSNTSITRLPVVVCTLYNLQTLLLSGCSSLTELPADLRKLINLRHLDIDGTGIQEMPVQMGSLKRLRTLTAFAVGKSPGSGIGELREFPHLRGKLSILNLQNVANVSNALQANLKTKKDVNELELAWSIKDVDDSQKERDVADKLQPCANLEKLSLVRYGGTSFPKWLTDSSLCRVQVMRLSDCKYCMSLPPVGSLPALKELYVKRMICVTTIGADFYGGSEAFSSSSSSAIKPFQSLELLEFEEMPEWEEWLPNPSGIEGQCPDFPRLKELRLMKCPKLRGSLPNHLPCLTSLRVYECGVLHDESNGSTTAITTTSDAAAVNMELVLLKSLESMHINDGCPGLFTLLETKFPSNSTCFLRDLTLMNCPSLSMFPSDGLPTTLTNLDIVNCRRLEFLPQIPKLISLGFLTIDSSCDSMRSFPFGIFPKLQALTIKNCGNLESLSISVDERVDKEKNLRCLIQLFIYNCPNLVSFPHPGGGWPAPNLTYLNVSDCEKLKSLPESIRTLTTLRHLFIGNLPNLASFTQGDLPPNLLNFGIDNCDHVLETLLENQLLPTTLHALGISRLSSLKSLDGKGLGRLTSLQQLYISLCPSLQLLPEEGMPTSLSFLKIWGCSALEKRYNNKTGQEWAKISHIPCIQIGEQVII